MTSPRRKGLGCALAGGLLLAVATPPEVFPGAAFLVVAGLAAWFATATASARPWLHSYVLGCVHMAWFSWSVRHVLLPAYVAIVLVGGLYFVLGTAAVRSLPGRLRGVGFAVAVGASFWLRAAMPEIYYPHGQPCHCLWSWPALLGSLRVGGEPLGNALLGGLAAAAVGLWRSWRVAEPAIGRALTGAGFAVGAALLATVVGWVGASPGTAAVHVTIAAIEPGVHPMDPYIGLPREQQRARFDELFEERLLAPTRALLAEAAPPELILWPESSVPGALQAAEAERRQGRLPVVRFGSLPKTRLLVGANVERAGRDTPAAVLLSTDGRVLGHHEKRCLVPGGEFLPFVHWLPDAVREAVHEAFRSALGSAPDCAPGRSLPPLQTAAGVPFGALLCYDNAFPGPAREQVAAGARVLCVLSNEAWYRGGGELTQLVAMTVCRAIELRTPIVRCTTDGWTVAVDASGRILAELPMQPSPAPAARVLRAALPVPAASEAPPWLPAAVGPGLAVLLGLALACGAVAATRRGRAGAGGGGSTSTRFSARTGS